MSSEQEFQQRSEQIEQLVARANALENDEARTTALELLQSMMDLHGAAITRIVEVLSDAGEAGRSALAKLGSDPLICGLMVLYDVHPVRMPERVAAAIEKVRPQLRKHGGSVELLGINDGVVQIEIHASGHGCHSSPDALKQQVEQAILEAAPETGQIIVHGDAASSGGFIPINMLQPAAR
jgi:Fe-S cluster biogenesis protein NfuA